MLPKSKAHTGFLSDPSRLEYISRIESYKIVRAEALYAFSDYISRLVEEIMSGAFVGDIRFSHNCEPGHLRFDTMLDEVNDFYYSLTSHSLAGGRFRKFNGLTRDQVLSDYRLSLHYYIAMHATLRERFVMGKTKAEKELGRKNLLMKDIPTQYFFCGHGFPFWDAVTQITLINRSRMFNVNKNKVSEDDVVGCIHRLILPDGEMIHGIYGGDFAFVPVQVPQSQKKPVR